MATPKRARTTGRSFDQEMMALVGEYARASPISVAIYAEFEGKLELDAVITRVRPGTIEGRKNAPMPLGLLEPMELLSAEAIEVYLDITRDDVMPTAVMAVVYRGGKAPPSTLTKDEEKFMEEFGGILCAGDEIAAPVGTLTREEVAKKAASYAWRLLN